EPEGDGGTGGGLRSVVGLGAAAAGERERGGGEGEPVQGAVLEAVPRPGAEQRALGGVQEVRHRRGRGGEMTDAGGMPPSQFGADCSSDLKRFRSAAGRSGKRNSNPSASSRFGTQRRPVNARHASVPMSQEPTRTAHVGTGGLQGRRSAFRNSRMNS